MRQKKHSLEGRIKYEIKWDLERQQQNTHDPVIITRNLVQNYYFNKWEYLLVLFQFTACNKQRVYSQSMGGAVASWLARPTLDRAVHVGVLARDVVLCSWARHFTLTVPLSTQVYKWVSANLMLGVNLWLISTPQTGICSGLMGHLARMQTLPTFYWWLSTVCTLCFTISGKLASGYLASISVRQTPPQISNTDIYKGGAGLESVRLMDNWLYS